MKQKLIKYGSLVAVVVILVSCFVLPASAFNPIYPISINNYDILRPNDIGTLLFLIVDNDGNELYNITDHFSKAQLTGGVGLSQQIVDEYAQGNYLNLRLTVEYTQININGFNYNLSSGVIQLNSINQLNIKLVTPVSDGELIPTRTYNIRINLSDPALDVAYNNGYNAGYSEGQYDADGTAYETGYNDGVNASDSAKFGYNLLGTTLNAPINALNQFVLFEAPFAGHTVSITLGTVVGAVIALSLFMAFLKLYAGG